MVISIKNRNVTIVFINLLTLKNRKFSLYLQFKINLYKL